MAARRNPLTLPRTSSTTALAIETLARLKKRNQPFFLAVGYYRPHLPFVAPKKYWDLYDRDKISPAKNPFLPTYSPVMAMNSAYELKGCYDLEYVKHPAKASLPEGEARRLKHGYYASVSFVDACFGRLIEGLAHLELDGNTIVVVWGDHGWKLGEHGSWCKQTNYDIDVRVPLLVRTPGTSARGAKCERLVELVDLFPTLCDVAGVEIPDDLEGTSFAPLLRNPKQSWKSAAFSQFHRSPGVTPDGGRYMGYSMITPEYHYVEWRDWDAAQGVAGDVMAVELYHRKADPGENTNIARFKENGELVTALAEQLDRGWRAARPADQ
jgi:arylsulfatase A-like enzyme